MYTPKISISAERKRVLGRISILLLKSVLGLMLFIKGILFLRNEGVLRQVFSEAKPIQKLSTLQVLIPWMHILGGFFILIGLYTRWAILVQLPLVVGAIFILLAAKEYPFFNTEITFAIIILLLLIVCFKYGDGFYSWRNLIRKEKDIF